MYLVAIAWIYVVLMMAIAEAISPIGTVLGALITFALYGVLPLSIVLYLMNTPARRRAQRLAASHPQQSSGEPDASGHAAGDPVAAEREKA